MFQKNWVLVKEQSGVIKKEYPRYSICYIFIKYWFAGM